MRALITGASGYLGGHLLARLAAAGHMVHAIVRPTSDRSRVAAATQLHVYDGTAVSLEAAVRAARPEVVFHLAAGTPDAGVDAAIGANLTFGARLLHAMSLIGAKTLINCGTYWEYDTGGGYAPNSFYAATKRAFQDVIPFYVRRDGLCAVTLVMFDVYGPNDWRPKLLPHLIAAMRSGETVAATPGEQCLDLVYIDDVVDGLIAASGLADGAQAPLVYALASGRRVTLRQLADMVEQATGRTLKMDWGKLPYREGQIFDPVATLPLLPGWQAKTPLEDGLRRSARID